MDLKKIGKALLFPHIAVMICLIPVSAALLIYSMVKLGTESAIAIISYVIAAYTLTVWCFKIPKIIIFFKTFKNENKYFKIWLENERLRVNVSLYSSLIFNTLYAVFQLCLGMYHSSFWFYSMAWYYISLAGMRLFLARYTVKNKPGENMKHELSKYRLCGWVFLIMNLALTVMLFFMIYFGRTFKHHEITTIALAAYTFFAFTTAIISIVKYRKYNSPVYTAAKIINLAAACVSMLTLESTMLTTFGDGTMSPLGNKIMLGSSGAAVSAFIIFMAVYMIMNSTEKIKKLKKSEEK